MSIHHTHITWSIEGSGDTCPKCKGKTVLVIAPSWWRVDADSDDGADDGEYDDEGVEVDEEITGHYCRKCGDLVSLSLNA